MNYCDYALQGNDMKYAGRMQAKNQRKHQRNMVKTPIFPNILAYITKSISFPSWTSGVRLPSPAPTLNLAI